MTEMKQALEHLLDFSKPFDVGLFDKAAEAFFQGHSEVFRACSACVSLAHRAHLWVCVRCKRCW